MYIDDDRNLLAEGTQQVKEKLMRLVCKYTDRYATDLLIYFESYFLDLTVIHGDEETRTVAHIYIRQNGVEWDRGKKGFKKPKLYRYHAMIVKEKGTIKLYGEQGNC